jgi:hypothetical protein
MPEGNKVYVAGKVGNSEEAVKRVIKQFETLGYQITYDWTLHMIQKPFEGNPAAVEAAERMARGVMEADTVVVLCQSEGGVGYHIETGGALIASLVLGFIQGERRRRILAVGEGNHRSVFYYHPAVTRVDTVISLFEGDYFPQLITSSQVV